MRSLILSLTLASTSAAFAGQGAGVVVPELPGAYRHVPADAKSVQGDRPWWRTFDDPRLDDLLAEGLAGNLDLAAARDRVEQARSLEWTNAAALSPTLSFDTQITGQPASLRFAAFSGGEAEGVDGFFYQGSTGFNAAWNLDIFGRGVLGVQAAVQDRQASDDDADGAAVSLTSALVGAWFDVALLDRAVTITQGQIESNERLLEIVQLRFDRGEATAVDVLQQRNQVASSRAALPPLRARAETARQQLAVLLGRSADGVPAALPTELPELPAPPDAGRPEDLLRHRPDLRAAERRLQGAWQRRMQSERQFLPTLGINANAGWSFTNNAGQEALFNQGDDPTAAAFQQLEGVIQGFDPSFEFDLPEQGDPDPPGFQQWFSWSIGAQLSIPLWGGGRNVGGLKQARAAERAAAHTLAQTQLRAVSAVETAYVSDTEQRHRLAAIREQRVAASAAYDAARDRYVEGIGDYLTVLSTLVASQGADFQALQAHRDALSARIQLHEALGGSWTTTLSGGAP